VAVKLHALWQFLHLVFGISWVSALVVAEWNGRAARATADWSQRALLFQIVYLVTRTAGAGSLFVAGLLGHVSAVTAGYSMASDHWLWWVTGVWLAAVFVMFLLNVPLARRLADLARVAAAGGASEGWDSALARWRGANVAASVLYLALLLLMVLRWHS
jgi:hypothetical protein